MRNLIVLKMAAAVVVAEYRFAGEEGTDLELIEHARNVLTLPGEFAIGGYPIDMDPEDATSFAYAIIIDADIEDIKEALA